jgi:predicted PurR-regulated permease PerM
MGVPDRSPNTQPPRPNTLVHDLLSTLGRYLSAQLRICLILTVIYGVGFLLLRVPVWPLLAFVCGLSHAVPMFGAPVAAVLAAGVTWIGRGFDYALGVMGLFIACQVLEGFYLGPKIMGHRLSLPPLWVFFGTLLASSLFGFVGVLLAVPAMALAAVVWRWFHRES